MAEDIVDDLAIYALLKLRETSKRKRRMWTKTWLLKRRMLSHTTLLEEIRAFPEDFNNFMRMDEETYLHLLSLVSPFIAKQSTVMRDAISPHERLTMTLRYLATGRTYQDLKFSACVSQPSLSKIIPDTCSAIYTVLAKEYLKFPATTVEWLQQAKLFENMWQFPNCLGAVDGKHVAITPPPESGSFFYNYKGFHSMVLMAIANANYELLYVNFGTNGRVSDGGVIENTNFHQRLCSGSLNLPGINPVNGLPHVFISDEAFALRENFLKPYNAQVLDKEKRIFNYRLSRARRVVENVFGIMVSRFGVLQHKINLKPENIDTVVLACCALHNFLRRNATANYTPPESLDTEDPCTHKVQYGLRAEGNNLAVISPGRSRNAPEEAKLVRDNFKHYFNTDGRVPWQDKYTV